MVDFIFYERIIIFLDRNRQKDLIHCTIVHSSHIIISVKSFQSLKSKHIIELRYEKQS